MCFADCLNDLKGEFEDNQQPIGDDNQILHRFCAKLEFLLQYGMKGTLGYTIRTPLTYRVVSRINLLYY